MCQHIPDYYTARVPSVDLNIWKRHQRDSWFKIWWWPISYHVKNPVRFSYLLRLMIITLSGPVEHANIQESSWSGVVWRHNKPKTKEDSWVLRVRRLCCRPPIASAPESSLQNNKAIRGLQHKQHTVYNGPGYCLHFWGTFACSAGPYRSYWAGAGTKNKLNQYF